MTETVDPAEALASVLDEWGEEGMQLAKRDGDNGVTSWRLEKDGKPVSPWKKRRVELALWWLGHKAEEAEAAGKAKAAGKAETDAEDIDATEVPDTEETGAQMRSQAKRAPASATRSRTSPRRRSGASAGAATGQAAITCHQCGTGMTIEKAGSVGQWFRTRYKCVLADCPVEVVDVTLATRTVSSTNDGGA